MAGGPSGDGSHAHIPRGIDSSALQRRLAFITCSLRQQPVEHPYELPPALFSSTCVYMNACISVWRRSQSISTSHTKVIV